MLLNRLRSHAHWITGFLVICLSAAHNHSAAASESANPNAAVEAAKAKPAARRFA
jgi:hypothetical protein